MVRRKSSCPVLRSVEILGYSLAGLDRTLILLPPCAQALHTILVVEVGQQCQKGVVLDCQDATPQRHRHIHLQQVFGICLQCLSTFLCVLG
jgi:hypothetical protein